MKFLLCLALVSPLVLAEDLGQLMRLKIGPTGKPAFGISYTYGKDSDGSLYFLSATPNVSPAETTRELVWNFYLRSEQRFLFDWETTGKVSLAVFQIRVDGPPEVVDKMVRAQKYQNNGDLFLVLGDSSQTPVYHLPISQFCAQFPQNFNDLTHGLSCDAPAPNGD